ncbi:hypothetical protein [Planctomicrobium sp. SH664]|uniref:hypothetical protein n=1 Tax=Planctomicrobium sp. SH664 TaxID=3448125 RepID=UPI003F5BCDC7
MSAAQAEEWRRSPAQFRDRDALKATKPSAAQVKSLQKIVHYYLSRLLHNDVANLPKEVVDRFTSEIFSQLTTPEARIAMMDAIIDAAPDLLSHPNPLIRTNTMWLLAQLSVKNATSQPGGVEIPAVPYNPVYKILLQVLTDKNQLLECRIIAARGLARVCRDAAPGAPSSVEKSEIAVGLVTALDETEPSVRDDIAWFRGAIIEALGYVDRVNDVQDRPIVIDTLLSVVMNPRETFDNRSLAARGISQLPLPGNVNVPLVTYEIVKLLRDMSLAYNKQPQYTGWRRCFTNIYLAFRPALVRHAKERKWGLLYVVERPGLQGNATFVKGAWEVVFELTTKVIGGSPPPIPGTSIQALTDWLGKNEPTSRQVTPLSKAI